MTYCSFKGFDEYAYMQHGFGARPSIKKISANRRASVGAAAMTKMIKIPSNAKTVEIGQKPKRGRPAAAKKALEHQQAPVAPAPVKKRKAR